MKNAVRVYGLQRSHALHGGERSTALDGAAPLTRTPERTLNLRVGDVVEVRSREEILRTLDENGCLDALPFMPEMLRFCGQRFQVYKRADKTCDTIVHPAGRRMTNAVHLSDVRCDGAAHGGCQAGCLIFWKEAWLKPVGQAATLSGSTEPDSCDEAALYRAAQPDANSDAHARYYCQATELRKATSALAWWDVRQYIRDVRSGNVGVFHLLRVGGIAAFNAVVRQTRRVVFGVGHLLQGRRTVAPDPRGASATTVASATAVAPNPVRGDQGILGGVKTILDRMLMEYPGIRGSLQSTPSAALNLQPGELVQIKSKAEILRTLDVNNRNRGLSFDVEMVPYCGGIYRVLRRVERIINEKTGKMMKFSNDCIVLEEVVCTSCYSRNRLFCPRSIYPYWREIWLTRVK